MEEGDMGRLDGKTAIVTGAGSGIGRAAAGMLADEGAQIVVAGRRLDPIMEIAAEIEARGGRAVARQADIEDEAQARELARWTLKRFGRVDILVNNAGHSSTVKSVRWVDIDTWDSVLRVNVTGPYLLIQEVLPGMLERGEGTIVTVTSFAALNPSGLGGAAYGAAKAGSLNLMRNVNLELRNRGIRACAIVPAEVDTPILNKRPLPPTAEQRATMMKPEDVASAILFCATMPQRTVVEEIRIGPTVKRDVAEELLAAAREGAPEGVE